MEQRRLGLTQHHKGAGLTLIELLIAVAIFSVIAVALYSSFNAGIRAWRRGEANMELHQRTRLALAGMAKELRNTISFAGPLSKEPASGRESDDIGEGLTEKPDLYFSGSRDELVFVTLASKITDKGDVRKELAKIRYFLDKKNGLNRSSFFQSKGFGGTGTGEEALIPGIEELKFEYAYEDEEEGAPPVWKDNWQDQEGVPLGVKIYLKVKEKETGTSEFSKTVFIPTGTLGKTENGE